MEENQMIENYQNGIDREKILEYFYKQYDKCLWLFANKYYGYGKSVDDAFQDNFLKMIDCLEKFDTTSGNRFITYLYPALENEFRVFLRTKNDDFYKRHKLMFSYDTTLLTKDGDESDFNPYDEGTNDTYSFEGEIDERYFYSLSDEEKEIVDMLVQGKTQLEISKELNYSQANISKIILNIRSIVGFNIDKLKNGYTPPNFIGYDEDDDFEEEIDEKYLELVRSKSKYDERIGETITNSNGYKMTIVEYKGIRDIDVQFEDGTIVKHVNYTNFKKGNIAKPGYKKLPTYISNKGRETINEKYRRERIGLKCINQQGYEMVIVDYINANHMYVQFEDGTTKKCSFDRFKNGGVVKPGTKRVGNRYKCKGEE